MDTRILDQVPNQLTSVFAIGSIDPRVPSAQSVLPVLIITATAYSI